MTTASRAQVSAWADRREHWRERVVRGSAILLLSNGVVAATNLFYNILLARWLGAAGFGHASALYTLLMLITAITLAFQIITSKFIARNSEIQIRTRIYATLLRRAWQVGGGVAAVLGATSIYLKSFLNLPAEHDLALLALAAGVYVPLGVRRGKMQGCYEFGGLALNLVAEVAVKLGVAVLCLRLGMGVTGVMVAVVLSIVAAYVAGSPGPGYRGRQERVKIAPFGEGMQAGMYFVGQVILSNLDVLLVKHFFSPLEAGIYAAIALVGRVVFMLSWSVVSSMFPVSASHSNSQAGRSVLYTGLLLVGGVTTVFVGTVALAPRALWAVLLGKTFLSIGTAEFASLLSEYALMTTVYCLAVVVMMYEISQRIGTSAWVQLVTATLLAGAIWRYHSSLSEVILVQMIVMGVLLAIVVVPLLREPKDAASSREALFGPLQRLRAVLEDEVIAEFLRGEFYHPDYDLYRQEFQSVVEHGDLSDSRENDIRRALLFRRRGRLWRELPNDTEWWEVELTARDLDRLQTFPRNKWRRFAGRGFNLAEMLERIEAERARGRKSQTVEKLDAIAADLLGNEVPNSVMLIGTHDGYPLTIIEGNHRMMAAILAMPESAHRRFRFYCGFSARMDSCCWHKTHPVSVMRYAGHMLHDFFYDRDPTSAAPRIDQKPTGLEASRNGMCPDSR